jgi:hypothetical protein
VMGALLMGMDADALRPVMSLVSLNVNVTGAVAAWRVGRRGDAKAVERRARVDEMVEAFIFAGGLDWCGWFCWWSE